MTEGDPKQPKDKAISDFDSLVGAVKSITERAATEGRTVPETPAIDNYINEKKKKAGSPSDALESNDS